MAIVRNMWMRNTRQQVAGAVLYNLKGQTIQREKASQVANPRTTAQMDQRVKLANLVNFYRANKAWMSRGAFESKKQTWSDYNAFVSVNIDGNRVALPKQQASEGQCIVAPYQVTKGTLPKFNVSGTGTSAVLNYGEGTAPTTWGAFSTRMISAYPGLQNGDQISFIIYNQDEDGVGRKFVSVNPIERNLNTEDTTTLASLFSGWTFGAESLTFTTSTIGGNAVAVSICVSRSVSGAIKVNDSFVVMFEETVLNEVITDSALAYAIASYGGSSVNFLDNGTSGLSSSAANGSSGGSGAGDPGDVTP